MPGIDHPCIQFRTPCPKGGFKRRGHAPEWVLRAGEQQDFTSPEIGLRFIFQRINPPECVSACKSDPVGGVIGIQF
jgi:hypothetical protein